MQQVIRFFLVGCASMMLAVSAAQAADVQGAKIYVDALAKNVLAVVQDKKLTRTEKQATLNSVIDQNVDIDFVAKFVLGKHWNAASPKQRQDYLVAYRPFLHKNYVGKLTRYSGQSYTLGNGRDDGDGRYFVGMEIVDPQGQNVEMNYRIRSKGTGYTIADIVVEGVSLVATQRSEFNAIVSNKGLDHLIRALQKQAEKQAS